MQVRYWEQTYILDEKEDFRFKKAVCPKCGKELMVREGIPEGRAYDKENSRIISMVLKGIWASDCFINHKCG